MKKNNVLPLSGREEIIDPLTDLLRSGMLHMMFKVGQCAEKNWRRLRGFDYLVKVR